MIHSGKYCDCKNPSYCGSLGIPSCMICGRIARPKREQIGIVYTTFLRPQLAQKTLESIKKHWHSSFRLFIGEQLSNPPLCPFQSSAIFIDDTPSVERYFFPFDTGVSYVRNDLIEQIANKGIKYCLVTADSIAFIPETIAKLDQAVQFLEEHPGVGILGFDLKDRTPWEWFMDIKDQRFHLYKTGDLSVDESSGLRVKRCDICRQFFIARVDAILKVQWDEVFKTGDHEDFFWRFKQSGYQVYWTSDIVGQYVHDRSTEYAQYRNRQYDIFMKILFKKYNLQDWVEYHR